MGICAICTIYEGRTYICMPGFELPDRMGLRINAERGLPKKDA